MNLIDFAPLALAAVGGFGLGRAIAQSKIETLRNALADDGHFIRGLSNALAERDHRELALQHENMELREQVDHTKRQRSEAGRLGALASNGKRSADRAVAARKTQAAAASTAFRPRDEVVAGVAEARAARKNNSGAGVAAKQG